MKYYAFTRQYDENVRTLYTPVSISKPAYIGQLKENVEDHPEIFEFEAVWDTGATGTVISEEVVSQLGIQPIDRINSHTANGTRIANVFLVNVYLPNDVVFPGLRVIDGNIPSTSVLIGMDIIGQGDFAVTHSDNKTCMSFRLPSLEKIDFL